MVIRAVPSTEWKYYTMVHPCASPPNSVCSEDMLTVDNLKLATMGVFTPWTLADTIHQRGCFVFVVFLSLLGDPVFKYFLAQHCCVLKCLASRTPIWQPSHPRPCLLSPVWRAGGKRRLYDELKGGNTRGLVTLHLIPTLLLMSFAF